MRSARSRSPSIASEHCPPDRFPGEITEPVVPPAKAAAYKCGEAWSILVEHASGRPAADPGQRRVRRGRARRPQAEVAYLGIGQLGKQDAAYIEAYWEHTVRAVGARRVVLIHWDDFFRPLDQPLRALPYLGDDLDATMRVLVPLAEKDGVSLHFPTVCGARGSLGLTPSVEDSPSRRNASPRWSRRSRDRDETPAAVGRGGRSATVSVETALRPSEPSAGPLGGLRVLCSRGTWRAAPSAGDAAPSATGPARVCSAVCWCSLRGTVARRVVGSCPHGRDRF